MTKTASPYRTTDEIDLIAATAHAGQTDKLNVPYISHVRTVARGVAALDPAPPAPALLAQAALLHDAVEDTHLTGHALLFLHVNPVVVDIVARLTRTPDQTYDDYLAGVITDRRATLVKIADNAHNSQPQRLAQLPPDKARSLAKRYHKARDVLWPAADRAQVDAILAVVNRDLLEHGNVPLI